MKKNISRSVLPLAALVLFSVAVAGAASAQPAERQLLLAQGGPPPQSQEAAPNGKDADDKDKKGRKHDRNARPPGGPGAEGGAPKKRNAGPPGKPGNKPAGQAGEGKHGLPPKTVGEKKPPERNQGTPRPPIKAQGPAKLPSKAQAPVKLPPNVQAPAKLPHRAQAPVPPPSVAPQQPQFHKQAEPGTGKAPEKNFHAAPKQGLPPEAARAPAKAAAPPPKGPAKPQVTKAPGPKPQGPKPPEKSAAKPHRGPPGGFAGTMDNIKKQRRQRTEEGGKRTVIEEPGNRVIVEEGGEARIRHDETERLRRTSRDVRNERGKDGTNVTIALRPGGIEIYSVFDTDGRLLRRYRRGHDGRETNLIDNRRHRGERDHRDRNGFGFFVDLGPPRIGIPRERYIVDYDRASDDDIYDALMAPPVDELDRGYSLDEIRYNRNLRDRMRRVDLDTVNFEFGSWDVGESQYEKLARVAHVINRILDRHPDEIFLVEGHTDAVGSDIDNLTLSDRRAEEVAYILTERFNVPPENLVTQGYGEQYLKIETPGPERINRRVAVRRITPLMSRRQ